MPEDTTTTAASAEATAESTPADNAPNTDVMASVASALTGQGGASAQPTEGAAPDEAVIDDRYQFKLAEALEVSPDVAKDFIAIAKSAGLKPSQADKLIDMHSKLMLDQISKVQDRNKAWADETAKQGLATPEGLRSVKLALDTFGGGEVTRSLTETGLIYNPSVFKMFKVIGDMLSEDTAPEGKASTSTRDLGTLFFPNSN